MHLPKSLLYPEQARLLVPATLDFLAATHAFYTAHVKPPYPGYEIPDYRRRFTKLMEESQAEVNSCLKVIGGLAIRYTDSETNKDQACVVKEWLGYDNATPNLMSWSMAGTPAKSYISLEVDAVLGSWSDVEPQYRHSPVFLDLARHQTDVALFDTQHPRLFT